MQPRDLNEYRLALAVAELRIDSLIEEGADRVADIEAYKRQLVTMEKIVERHEAREAQYSSKAEISADIDLDLSLLDTLLIRCGACLQKYSIQPHQDQTYLTHLYECPHCKHPLDSRAWLYAIRNLQKMVAAQHPSERI